MKTFIFALGFILSSFALFAEPNFSSLDRNKLREGDLIFHKGVSHDLQSEAIRQATASDWTHVGVLIQENNQWEVIEATGDQVQINSLDHFLKDSKALAIKRFGNGLTAEKTAALKAALMSFLKRPYDKFFEWGDDAIYCAELAWKAYNRALKVSISEVERFKNLHLETPAVQGLMKQRYTAETQKKLKLEEKIVTVATMLKSKVLKAVYDAE